MAPKEGIPTIEVKADVVLARMASIPERVRNRLRVEIPGLTTQLADRVRAKLAPGALGTSQATGLPLFATSNRLTPAITSKMIETVNTVSGRVYVDANTFPAAAAMSLEYGARPHIISAQLASALFFFWPKVGKNVAFQSVNHPGFPGASFMRSSLAEMRATIRDRLKAAVGDEVRK